MDQIDLTVLFGNPYVTNGIFEEGAASKSCGHAVLEFFGFEITKSRSNHHPDMAHFTKNLY